MSLDRGFKPLNVLYLGEQPYTTTVQRMRGFTHERFDESTDQIWLLEHPSVYTLGKSVHQDTHTSLPAPVVRCDRGGKITYHGPGQLITYTLLNLRYYGLGIRSLVALLERSVVEWLLGFNIQSCGRKNAPGVYVENEKIASLGLRIHRSFCYHGVSINFDGDLSFFNAIEPCGIKGLTVTSVAKKTNQRFTTSEKIQHHWRFSEIIKHNLQIKKSEYDAAESKS